MRAATMEGFKQPIVVRDLPDPELNPKGDPFSIRSTRTAQNSKSGDLYPSRRRRSRFITPFTMMERMISEVPSQIRSTRTSR